MSSHRKKSDDTWKQELREFAITGNLPSRGKAPRKEDKKWYPVYDAIRSCAVTKSKALGAGKAQPTFLPPPKCTCGWIHHATPVPDDRGIPPTVPAAATANNNNAVVLHPATTNFAIPKKPLPRTTINDVRHKHTVYKSAGYYDLEVFGFVDGKCPHCHRSPSSKHTINTKIKIIHTLGEPRFVQGIGMFCDHCKGTGWQTYEQTYVDTLTKEQKQKLNAVIVGSADGIDMDVVVQMRMGTSASSLEKTSRCNLIRRHCARKEVYTTRCKTLGVTPNIRGVHK